MSKAVWPVLVLSVLMSQGCTSLTRLPGSSQVSGPMADQTIDNLRTYEQNHNGCSLVRVIAAEHVKSVGDIRKNPDGFLQEGTLVERWSVDACGKEKTYRVVLTGSPENGSYFTAFQELEAPVPVVTP